MSELLKDIKSIHFEAVFNYASWGIIISDKNGHIIAVNPYTLKEFGYTQEDLSGCSLDLLFPVKTRSRQTKSQILNSKSQFPKTTIICTTGRKQNGTDFPVEINQTSYKINRKQYNLIYITNITERKKVQAEIESLSDSLEATVEKRTSDLQNTLNHLGIANAKLNKAILFQNAILENAGAIIFSCDRNGILQTFNHEAESELGYSAKEIVGKKTLLIFHLPDELKKRSKEYADLMSKPISGIDLLFSKASMGFQDEQEWTYVRKNGANFPVLLKITTLKDDQQQIIGYLVIGLNITERKKTEQDLTEALEKEKELSELKSRFVSIASHEFRTPLSTILSSIYLIEQYRTTGEQPKREVHLQRIMEATKMLNDILNDFLSVGKIEEGKITIRPVLFNIKEMSSKLLDEIRITLKEKQTITYRHLGCEEIQMDVSLMKQILMNLLSNASKFSDPGGKISLRTSCTPEKLILTVSDNGIGIPEEDQKHLMERFFRATNTGNIQGTGLGLHIISKYAELMNGNLTWSSKLGKGSTFKITFNL